MLAGLIPLSYYLFSGTLLITENRWWLVYHYINLIFFVDVRETSVLQESASFVGWHVNIDEMINGVGKDKLLQNTQEALDKGSFGVPRLVNKILVLKFL